MPKGPQNHKRRDCDKDLARFEAKLGKLAKTKPNARPSE
jgi:hypothetical protein